MIGVHADIMCLIPHRYLMGIQTPRRLTPLGLCHHMAYNSVFFIIFGNPKNKRKMGGHEFTLLCRCRPNCLWTVKIAKNGLTSGWGQMKATQALLSYIIDETQGHNLKQNNLAKQIDIWLRNHAMTWSFIDVEEAAANLRSMLSTLLAV